MSGRPVVEPQRAGSNLPEYTVSELSGALKRSIEQNFSHVRVRGEISSFKRHSSGHCYLCLKDAEAVLEAVCWRSTALRLPIKPEDGMEVVCTGRLTTFPGRSKYQLVIDRMELAGVGALLKMLEDRKQRLAAEGLFADSRKKKLPYLPRVIGVVTSPTGAVIRDILHRLADRFPRHVLVWPVAVQGDGAAQQVAAAIAGFNSLAPGGAVPRPDVLIVARGGGSLEDLMAFNEEVVVRAAAASVIPLISAVGHETDTTLIDFASDRRAPTPTAAAEIAVPVRLELIAELAAKGGRLVQGVERWLGERRIRVDSLRRGLPDADMLLAEARQRLDERGERWRRALANALQQRRERIGGLGARLRHPRDIIASAGLTLAGAARGLSQGLRSFLTIERHRLHGLGARLQPAHVDAAAERARTRLGDLPARLVAAAERQVAERDVRLLNQMARLDGLNPERVLARGYAIVRDAAGHPVQEAAAVRPGNALAIQFQDGRVEVVAGGSPRPRVSKSRSGDKPDDQGRLF